MAELSIIVPIYNVEKYLKRCIESILNQTYKDFELILINDGSSDKCADIMEYYARKDERIITIYQQNKGVSAARNAGLKIATGKYIGFVDPDDWIDACMYEKLIAEIQHTGTDMACCNWYEHYVDRANEHCINNVEHIMKIEKFICHIFDKPRTILGTTWNKLFLKENIRVYYNENIAIGEDTLFVIENSLHIKDVCFVNEPLYHVFARDDSAIRKNPARLVEGLEVTEKIIDLLSVISPLAVCCAEADYLDACYRIYKMLEGTNEEKKCLIAKMRFEDYVKHNIRSIFMNSQIYWKTKALYFMKVFIR